MAELRRISFPNGSHSVEASNGDGEYHHNYPQKSYTNSYKKSSYELSAMKRNGEKKHGTDNGAPAVVVRNASKHFSKGVPVLENFNMTVQRGSIYSLLGSSGCGKTTTLRCITGGAKLSNDGHIWVLGAKPGVKGKYVGYMPQETSLYGDFSIAETLSYFGTLCGMNRDAAAKGTAFLIELLRLPASSRRVGTLSGGQRRRVSFAVALIHDPELLILDEPTVGVDPLLRESIWNHLVRLSRERGTTVLITTHYIDEAKDSNAVGVMRDHHLLVETNPALLLQRFNTTSLENVVLQLCRKEAENTGEDSNGRITTLKKLQQSDEESPVNDSPFTPPVENEDANVKIADSFARIKSLVHKNTVVLFRNLLLFLFTLVIPSLIIFVMCIAFKDDPKNLDFGIVNLEVTNASLCLEERPPPGECDIERLSCKYLDNIPADVIDMIYYKSEEEAAAAVHKGSIWGYIYFPENYSSIFYERSASGANVDEDVLNKSEIIVKMDQTSKNIVNRIKKTFHDGFEDYAKSILRDCGFDERQAEFALNYHTPVFGTDDTKFIDFIAPSITGMWLYFFPIIAAAIRYIDDKKQGTFERSLVAGTKTWEVLFAYGIAEGFVLILQTLFAYFVLTVLIGIEVLGSIPLVLLMFLMSGFGGVSMGFFIGSICNEEIEAALLAMALFFPNTFVSGVLWPLEGMPIALQYIAYFLPCTLSSESMRSIFTRGWSFSHGNVWPGYAAMFGWILFYFILTVIIQRLKSK